MKSFSTALHHLIKGLEVQVCSSMWLDIHLAPPNLRWTGEVDAFDFFNVFLDKSANSVTVHTATRLFNLQTRTEGPGYWVVSDLFRNFLWASNLLLKLILNKLNYLSWKVHSLRKRDIGEAFNFIVLFSRPLSNITGILNPWIWLAHCARSSGLDSVIRIPNFQCQMHAYVRF